MRFFIILVAMAALAILLRKQIKQHPMVFYCICVAFNLLILVNATIGLPTFMREILSVLMRRGGLGTALFVVVMYIGATPRASKVSRWLRPIRAELSISACILILGHVVMYLMAYVPVLAAGRLPKDNVFVSFLVAIVLLALLLALGGTSFRFVKRHMKARDWKKLQRCAYVFYALVYVHLIIMLLPATMNGSAVAIQNVAVYTLVFGIYLILRLRRAASDRRQNVDVTASIIDQGFIE